MTQTEAILRLLEDAGDLGITPLDALHHEGCFRLAARIRDLKDAGHTITTEMVKLPVSGKRVARYRLVKEEA